MGGAVRSTGWIAILGWACGLFGALLLVGAVLEGPHERDIRIPRVPPDQLEHARALSNPLASTETTRTKGKELFTLACVACHGPEGKGDGPVAKKSRMDPKPRDFTNPEFQRLRSDGELFWVLKHGSHETEMMRMDFFFTDAELWTLIVYIRTLGTREP
jgi:mono/diheme cytochrome c family protein